MEKLQFFSVSANGTGWKIIHSILRKHISQKVSYTGILWAAKKTGDKMRENKRSADFIAFKIVHKLLRCIWIASKKLSIFFVASALFLRTPTEN